MAGRPSVPPEKRDQIPVLARQGWSQQRIAEHLGLSIGYVNGVLKKPTPASPPSPPVDEPAPALDVIPDDADIATLEALQRKYEAMSKTAEADGNLQLFIALQRLIRDVLDRKRKWQPPPVEKPEDNPDMVRLGEEVAERLHKLVDDALRAAKEAR